MTKPGNGDQKTFDALVSVEVSKRDQQIADLQEEIQYQRDARAEDRFIFIVVGIILFDIVFFSVMPSFGGPIALLILQLLVLVALARRMGMGEVATILSRVLDRMSGKGNDADQNSDFKVTHYL